jgi:hypothetical protein
MPALPTLSGDVFKPLSPPPVAAPNFLASNAASAPPTGNPAAVAAPMPLMMPYNGISQQPQIVYVPVLQQAPAKPAGPTQAGITSVAPQPENGQTPKPPVANELKAPPPGVPGEPPTAQTIGYNMGKAIENFLTSNPELLDNADQLQLDDPDALAKRVHAAFHPLVKWVPDMVLDKAVKQMPLESQDMAGRLLDWLNTPESQLKSLTANNTNALPSAPRHPRPMSEAEGSEAPSSHRSPNDMDPFSDLGSSKDEPIEDEPGLRDRLDQLKSPLDHIPGLHRKPAEPSNLDDLIL